MILLGNTFPLALARRSMRIEPASLEELRQRVQNEGFLSFWGHDNTIAVATSILGFDPTPTTERPALSLSQDLLPTLNGQVCQEVWILSPDYAPGFRPQIGVEVTPEQILGWQTLKILF